MDIFPWYIITCKYIDKCVHDRVICPNAAIDEAASGIQQASDVWFPEPVLEMCIRSERYDQELTLLQLNRSEPVHHDEEIEEDTCDKLISHQ